MKILPISIDDLIHAKAVESVRREFKKTWNEPIREAALRTICAFANDLHNLNGGYLVIGIEDQEGRPVLPPHGLEGLDLDRVQKEIRGSCERIDPKYQPVISPEIFQGRQILILWVPGGDVRPYSAPEHGSKGAERRYYVRAGAETIEAKGEILRQLMESAARVPYDDRRRMEVPISSISIDLVRKFLSDIRSDLAASEASMQLEDLLRSMRLTVKSNGHDSVRNAALMFFTDDPEDYFPGARIEVVQFGDDAGGNLIEERQFRGPLPRQIRSVLDYLNSLSTSLTRKVPLQAEAIRFVAFPYEAMEEAISNAVLHRSYESPEPIKVYLYPDRLEIISYPGPVPGLSRADLQKGARPSQAPMRNRRIGDFLKELRLAEMRGTGIPTIRRKMSENGSPEPQFDFDDDRSYFRVTLPAHPEYVVLHALRESAQLWSTGERSRAVALLERARNTAPHSGVLAAQVIEYFAANSELARAQELFNQVERNPLLSRRDLVFVALSKAYLDRQQFAEARALLARAPSPVEYQDVVELAILHKRSGEYEKAHQLFATASPGIQNDAKATHEFAQTKLKLARKSERGPHARHTRRQLHQDALELLRRVVQLASDPVRKAWAWFQIAKTLRWLGQPDTDVRAACEQAIALLPDEPKFGDWLLRFEQSRSTGGDDKQIGRD